ncbi:MAG TPA: M23 family metallopeptidase [Thermoanaerobaculia bacterium]|jgi:murein DD-endopeptidase MepM/ murein hydrolase activator NlpD|nr:M23 family metallopeptidase [Thermoanaerobaculia bacterium]
MVNLLVRSGWVGRFALLSALLSLAACATTPAAQPSPAPQAQVSQLSADDDDFSHLVAQLRADLNRYNSREIARKPTVTPTTQSAKVRDKEFADRANALFTPLNSASLRMPVVGVRPYDLDDSWHAPRDGGERLHTGIDIFARKGTEVVAVADGIISYIGTQPKGGQCLWLTTENGASFYYAHLDRWAPGIYEGMEVQSGDLLGYVGNTGNAKYTPSHLHFAVNQNDEMVNPFPLLTKAVPITMAKRHVELGGGFGTR